MRYLCTNCSYIYDEWIWDLEDWYKAGTNFYEMKDYFICPSCSETIDCFHEIQEEINYIENIKNLTNLEKIHFPIIKESFWEIWVKINHPMEDDHFITSISLYDEYWDLVEEKFIKKDKKPEVKFMNYDLDEFEIRVRCNLHWVWSVGKIKRT